MSSRYFSDPALFDSKHTRHVFTLQAIYTLARGLFILDYPWLERDTARSLPLRPGFLMV